MERFSGQLRVPSTGSLGYRSLNLRTPSTTDANAMHELIHTLNRVDNLRFRLPVPNDPYTGNRAATFFGVSCPQQVNTDTAIIPDGFNDLADLYVSDWVTSAAGPWGEDCGFFMSCLGHG